MEKLKSFKGDKTWQELLLDYALYIILVIMIIGVIAADPTFLSKNNFLKILAQASTRGILALGVAGMIVLAGTDLSAGRILGCGAAISASLLQSVTYASRMYPQITEPLPLVLPLLLSIVVCVAFCLLNGFGVAKLHMHAFIISLGTQLIAYGALCLYIDSQKGGAQPIASLDPRYIELVNGYWLGIPHLVYFMVICAVIMWFVWNKTSFGKNMFAVGSNPEAANVSGVNVARTTILVHTLAGSLYGITGFIESARIGSNQANTGLNYECDAIAACVIGGVSFVGGTGKIGGVVLGVFILRIIFVALNFLSINQNLQYIIKGLIILIACSIDMRKYLTRK